MPATYIHELYQFESVLETALATALAANDLPSVVTFNSPDIAEPPVVFVGVTLQKVDDLAYIVNAGEAPVEFRWSGVIEVELQSRRTPDSSVDPDAHRALFHERVGRIRQVMHNIPALNALMTHHELATLYEGQTTRSINTELDLDVASLRFSFGLAIKTTAWPEPDPEP